MKWDNLVHGGGPTQTKDRMLYKICNMEKEEYVIIQNHYAIPHKSEGEACPKGLVPVDNTKELKPWYNAKGPPSDKAVNVVLQQSLWFMWLGWMGSGKT